jgi:uncharacterized protein (TIGR02466 family)|tara:strand:- start:5320 stop:5973 length:654 start_codon:yes stop_codon:yes gene_type:complete
MKDTIKEELHFASPIWLHYKPEWVKTLNKAANVHVKNTRITNKSLIRQTKDFGIIHHSGPLQGDPNFKVLLDYVVNQSWGFLKKQGYNLESRVPVVADFWVQEACKNGGAHQHIHVHPNSHVSGFYFLKASPMTSQPVFFDPRPTAAMSKLPVVLNRDTNPSNIQVSYQCNPGALIVFNSFLPHAFTVDPGKEPFRFIHWNVQAVHKDLVQGRAPTI